MSQKIASSETTFGKTNQGRAELNKPPEAGGCGETATLGFGSARLVLCRRLSLLMNWYVQEKLD
jgi:hypothetical protein